MPDSIGNIPVPEIAASGTFPIVPEYPYGRTNHPDVVIHQFGSGNVKIEQRFLPGTGARRFTACHSQTHYNTDDCGGCNTAGGILAAASSRLGSRT